MFSLVLASALALHNPVADPAPAIVQPGIFDIGILDSTQVMALPPELKAMLKSEVVQNGNSSQRRLTLLVDFAFRPEGLGVQYQYDANFTAEQVFRTRHANCLSFTLLFVAMAREVGLEAYAQEVREAVVWRQQGNTLYGTDHINAGVRIGADRYTVDVGSDEVIARYSPDPVSDKRMLAHYYNNRAADLMEQDLVGPAQVYMQRSLQLDPNFASSWNNVGVLQLRLGSIDAAERSYLRALKLKPMSADTLFNMVNLYKAKGEHKREASFERMLQRVQAQDPFHQFMLATQQEALGNYAQALHYYQRAVRLYGNEHRFYFGLARTYLHLGDARNAGRALMRAAQLSDGVSRNLYQAKLDRLRQLQR